LEAVQFPDGRPAKHGAASHEKCAAPRFASSLDRMVEHVLLIGDAGSRAEGALKDVLVIKMMGCLDEADARVGKIGHGLTQKRCDGDMVRVEDHDQFSGRLRERLVEVAGFGMLARALQIMGAMSRCQLPDLLAMA